MKYILIISLSLLIISCTESSVNSSNNKNTADSTKNPYKWVTSVHTELGVPFDSDTTDDYIIIRHQYVLSYNQNRNLPNWVAWELNSDWYGDVPRYSGNFITDTSLPVGMYRVKHADYTNSGYDRGHMVRSEERTKTEEDNRSTFILTNIIPQTPDLNQGVWLDLEYYCEDLCKKQNKNLYIVSGGIFHSDSTLKGEGKVKVPDSCFKVIVVLERGQGLNHVNENTEVIAVVMPNIQGVRKDKWEQYKTTVRRIEGSTGYELFGLVPKKVQDLIENR